MPTARHGEHTPIRLDLPRRLLAGCAVVSALALWVALVLGSWRAEAEVQEEMQAALDLAVVLNATWKLSGPSAVSDDEAALEQLQAIIGQRRLRHLELSIRDENGRRLWALLRDMPSALARESESSILSSGWMAQSLQRLVDLHRSWQTQDDPAPLWVSLPRPSGPHWSLIISPSPDSERRQALTVMLRLLLVLLLGSLLLLLVMSLQIRWLMRPMQDLLGVIAQMREGRWSAAAALPVLHLRELQAVAQALSDLGRTLADTEAQRQWLAQQVLTLQEDERRRIAQELHDELGQRLTALRLDLAVLQRQASDRTSHTALVANLLAQVQEAQQEVRELVSRLAPRADEFIEARQVVQWLQSLQLSRDGLRVHLQCEPGSEPWPNPMAMAIYRLSQEAITNTLRHAQASEAHLSVRQEAGRVHWTYRDNGCGLDNIEQAFRDGNGLAGMRQRAWAFGGDLQIDNGQPGLVLSAELMFPELPHNHRDVSRV